MAKKPYQVAAYYFPNWHPDGRNEARHGTGWTEWDVLRRAQPRFPGHDQPKIPLWGYEDESMPEAMAKKINTAADHGLDAFIFDWYWQDGPFLQRALDEGFLGAANNHRIKFALMWANHEWLDIHPASPETLSSPASLHPGTVSSAAWQHLVDHVVEDYFSHPSYWTIGGNPYFSIYEPTTLLRGMGGMAATLDALGYLRERTRAVGFEDIHLNLVLWQLSVLPTEAALPDALEVIRQLGVASIGSYVWLHHVEPPEFPATPYSYVRDRAVEHWIWAENNYTAVPGGVPFHPNVTMGWDPSPRTDQGKPYENLGYPYTPILTGNTPEEFKIALRAAREFLDRQAEGDRIVSINAWNEWTEGSYLEPDTVHGFEYLHAIKAVFG